MPDNSMMINVFHADGWNGREARYFPRWVCEDFYYYEKIR